MRAFVFLRQYAFSHKEFADKLKKLERKFNKKFKGIDEAINYLLSKDLVSENQKRRKRIGFKE